jgi:hypothetical protein
MVLCATGASVINCCEATRRTRQKGNLTGEYKLTVWLEVISLVASSCGYYRGKIEQRVAHECTAHVATQRGLAERPQHRHPPCAQPVAPLQERGTAQAP